MAIELQQSTKQYFVLPSALSINVREHRCHIPSNMYKVNFVSLFIFPSLWCGFHVSLFPLPSQNALLVSDPQLTTLLKGPSFAVLKSRISTLLSSSTIKISSCPSWARNGMVLQPIFLHLSVGFLLSHEFHMKCGVSRSDADPFEHESPVAPNSTSHSCFGKKRKGTGFAFFFFCRCLRGGILSLSYHLGTHGGSKRGFSSAAPLTNKAGVLSPKASGSSLSSVWREVAPCWYVLGVTWWLWKPVHFRIALTLCGFSVAVCPLGEFCPFLMRYVSSLS